MLDQSFSAKNFEVIYNLENRKGNISLDIMPEEYRNAVSDYRVAKNEYRVLEHLDKTLRGDSYDKELRAARDKVEIQKNRKDEMLKKHLEQIEKQVNSRAYRMHMSSFVMGDKEVFTLDDTLATFYTIKQLQYNIRKTFHVKQANRHAILSTIRTLLSSKIPLYVIRTDISGFYESIPQEKLLPMVNDNTLLSYKSKAFIRVILELFEGQKDTTKIMLGRGVPRGIGISAYLSELYMRSLDQSIKQREEVIFYARYVDDIFIICKSLPVGKKLTEYYADLQAMFAQQGLFLKLPAEKKCHLIDLTVKDTIIEPFDFLGYSFRICRCGGLTSAKFDLSSDKKKKMRERIDAIVSHFNNLACVDIRAAKRDLVDGLRLLTCNYTLFNTKSGVKVGLYYTNDLLTSTSMDGLDELTNYLHSRILAPAKDILHSPTDEKTRYLAHLSRKMQKVDFVNAWKNKLMYPFEMERLKEMEEWL